MPAIITHDFFGRDLLDSSSNPAGLGAQNLSIDEQCAFLLGSQGPDPLFYLTVDPRERAWKPLGSILHSERPTELLVALRHVIEDLDTRGVYQGNARSIGLAYAHGFLAHYALDSHAHPLIYAFENELCEAGVAGLGRLDGSYVHSVIETAIDEVVLFTKQGETIRTWRPYEQILQARDSVLQTASHIYATMAAETYQLEPPPELFAHAVKCFRVAQRALYSPDGRKLKAARRVERIRCRHSIYDALCHRPEPATTCAYSNDEHAAWVNPFTKHTDTRSFWNLYAQALADVKEYWEAFDDNAFSLEEARNITQGLNFSGDPV